jgi:hypothetical protein
VLVVVEVVIVVVVAIVIVVVAVLVVVVVVVVAARYQHFFEMISNDLTRNIGDTVHRLRRLKHPKGFRD